MNALSRDARPMPIDQISAADLHCSLESSREFALLDVRREGDFAAKHIFAASNLPLALTELRIEALVPRRATPIVLCDAGDGLAPAIGCSPASTCPARHSANMSRARPEPAHRSARARTVDAARRGLDSARLPSVRRIPLHEHSGRDAPVANLSIGSSRTCRRPAPLWWSIARAAPAASSGRSR